MANERQKRYAQTPHGKAARARAQKKWASANRHMVNASKRRRYRAQQEAAARIKLERGCVDCGYKASADALDFDHRDPTTKSFAIAKRYGQVSDERLLAEIAKCDVRCANCHRGRKT